MIDASALLKAALWYAGNGIPVFPCVPREKRPLTQHGFKEATTDSSRIESWWRKHPDANIGMPTGQVSGLLAIDLDPRNGGEETWDEIRAPYPATAEQITGGGGRHIVFRHPGVHTPKTLGPGIDLKGDGGYIVVAPSVHPSGNRYEWDGADGAKALLCPADAPSWLLKRLSGDGGVEQNGANARRSQEGYRQDERGAWGAGERNNRLAQLAGTLRRRELSTKAIEAALLAANTDRCNPPLPDSEVRTIANSIGKKPAGSVEPSTRDSKTGEVGLLVTRRMADIIPQPIQWLWPDRIARGKVSIIAGNPGLGKSQITAGIAAVVTTGGLWPVDRQAAELGGVVFLTAEDDAADTLRPRLEAAGADLDLIHVVDGVRIGYTGDGVEGHRHFSLEEDLAALERKLTEIGGVSAVIIDPISAYLGKTDSHKNAEVRALLAPLGDLATRHNVAIIGVSHLNKSSGAQALMRVTGSLAFVAAARAAYLVAADPKDKSRRLFLPMKNNIGPDGEGLGYRIESASVSSPAGELRTSRVMWEAEPVTMTADEAMQTEEPTDRSPALSEAKDWLEAKLAEGPLPASKVYAMAADDGIAKRTLRRASDALSIDKAKTSMSGPWMWSLQPKGSKVSIDVHRQNGGRLEGVVDTLGDEGFVAEVDL